MAGLPTVEAHASAGTEAAAPSSDLRIAVAALAVHFLWSVAASVRARRGTAPEAALVAHVGMGGTMSAMPLMMVV